MKSLHEELGQSTAFRSLEQEAHLSVARTAAVLEHAIAEALKPFDITPTQYNVLRILRGSREEGLCRNEVASRMIARVPDATRLLDRMEAAGLIQRTRDPRDRRFVTTHISEQGLRLVEQLDEPMMELHQRHFGHLTREELTELIDVLGRVRSELCG